VIGKIFHDGYNLYRFNDEYIFIQIILIGCISYLIGQILHEHEKDWHHQIPALRSSMDGDGRISTEKKCIHFRSFLDANKDFGRKKFVLGFDRGGLRRRLWIQNAAISWVKMALRCVDPLRRQLKTLVL